MTLRTTYCVTLRRTALTATAQISADFMNKLDLKSSFESNLSTISVSLSSLSVSGSHFQQSESMVEIKRSDILGSNSPGPSKRPDDEDKHRLVYSKSKVYVNPTAYARDNIPGFVALVKRVSSV